MDGRMDRRICSDGSDHRSYRNFFRPLFPPLFLINFQRIADAVEALLRVLSAHNNQSHHHERRHMSELLTTPLDPEQPAHIITQEEEGEEEEAVVDTNESAYDRDFFHRVVRDTGRWAFGVVLVEVWVLNAARTHLFRPDHGWWIDPYATDFGDNPKFDRLTDPTREDYLEAVPLEPGCGLPGALYAYSQAEHGNVKRSQRHVVKNYQSVTWREVKPIAEDPDQPYNQRLKFLATAGLGWAAGIPFSVGTSKGLVVYMARATVNLQKLIDPINVDYLTHATLVIGSAYALRIPRLKVEQARRKERYNTLQRVRQKLRVLRILNMSLESFVREESQRPTTSSKLDAAHQFYSKIGGTVTFIANDSQTKAGAAWSWISQKAVTTWKKCRGANVRPPPPFTWRQTLFTFFGCFVTLAVITKINDALTNNYGSEYSIVLGPFGALMTLQFGLTAAPASQPRNAILGQSFALLIAYGIGQSTQLEPWLQQTLATSLAIGVMVKCGVTHPPAGAAAVLFSTGKYSWPQIGTMLVGNTVAIACATFINNLSEQRNYPTFWGFRELFEWASKLSVQKEKKT